MEIAEAVFRGAEQRMRPMLMTALSAGVGLFPAAISHGIGSQVQRPLATVVVGGMFIGPLLLLVVAPALRKIFLSRERRRRCGSTAIPLKSPRRIPMAVGLIRMVATETSESAASALAACWLRARSAISGCAVGPNFARAGARRDRLCAGKTGVARPGNGPPSVPGQHFVTGADVSARWWAAFLRAAQRSDPAGGRAQSDPAGRRSRDQGRLIQRARAARTVLPAGHGQFDSLADIGRQSAAGAADSDREPQSEFSLVTNQLTVTFVPDIWGANFRAVENLDAVTEQQLFQLEAAYLALTSNVVTAAIQEASLRGQIAATQRIIAIERHRSISSSASSSRSGGAGRRAGAGSRTGAGRAMLPPLEKQLAQQRDLLTALAGQYSADEIGRSSTWRISSCRPICRSACRASWSISGPTCGRPKPTCIRRARWSASRSPRGCPTSCSRPTAARRPSIWRKLRAGDRFLHLGAGVTAPIFDGFTLYNKQKAAEAALEQAEAQYRATVITAFQNVADALRALQADARGDEAAVHAEETAKASLDIVQKQLNAGQVNQLAVLNAQQTYLTAAVMRVQAEANRLADTAALFMALGGGWPATCTTPVWRECAMGDPPAVAAVAAAEAK